MCMRKTSTDADDNFDSLLGVDCDPMGGVEERFPRDVFHDDIEQHFQITGIEDLNEIWVIETPIVLASA